MKNEDIQILNGVIGILEGYTNIPTEQDLILLKGIARIFNDNIERWITVKGNHIPILKGQSKEEAIERFLESKQNRKKYTGNLTKKIKGTVFELSVSKCITKEKAYQYPKTIANVAIGKPMTFKEADDGKVNPHYSNINYAYSHNCQSCVVAYEARRRGYNVKAAPFSRNGKTSELACFPEWAWLEQNKDKKCQSTDIEVTNGQECYDWLQKNVKYGARYQFSYNWEVKTKTRTYSGGHIVVMFRDDYGKLTYYDPQTNKILKDKEILMKKLNKNITYKKFTKPSILRVDDKRFNPYFMNDVMQKV